jgi:hypothetical protein
LLKPSEPRSTAISSCRILRNRGFGQLSTFSCIFSRCPGSWDPFRDTPTTFPVLTAPSQTDLSKAQGHPLSCKPATSLAGFP